MSHPVRCTFALLCLLLVSCSTGLWRETEALSASTSVASVDDGTTAATLVISDVNVIDVANGTVIAHRDVVIQSTMIVAVEATSTGHQWRDARLIDGRGRYLIPGLWDMHSHSLWDTSAMRRFLPLYVANGVTGIRDMGGTLEVLADYRQQSMDATLPWPRVVAAGQVLDGPEPIQPEISMPVADAMTGRAAVSRLLAAGADFIKVYTLLPRDAYFAVMKEAARLGLAVTGHVPASLTVEEASQAGQRSIEHLRDEIEPLCRPDAVQRCIGLATTLREHQTWQVPTLTVLRNKAYADSPELGNDPRLRFLPADLKQEWLSWAASQQRRGAAHFEEKRRRYADEQWLVRFLSQHGVSLLAGTDAGNAFCFPGFSLHDELTLMVEAGLTPQQALRSATLSAADYLDQSEQFGSINPGQSADLVLLGDNPLETIDATRDIDAVFLRGRYLDRGNLDELLESAARQAEIAAQP